MYDSPAAAPIMIAFILLWVAAEEHVTIMNVVVLLIQSMGKREKMESIFIISHYWIFISYVQVRFILFFFSLSCCFIVHSGQQISIAKEGNCITIFAT